jgi:hypothetical protein
MIAELAVTEQYGLWILFRAAWITLTVNSELRIAWKSDLVDVTSRYQTPVLPALRPALTEAILELTDANCVSQATEGHRSCRWRNSLVRPLASAAAAAL